MEYKRRYDINRKTINRLWINYVQVDYGPMQADGKTPRTWREKKMERADFGLRTLCYRTVKRMKIVYGYHDRMKKLYPNFQRQFVVRCDSMKALRKFHKFLSCNKDFGFTAETRVLFEKIKKEKRLNIFNELGS